MHENNDLSPRRRISIERAGVLEEHIVATLRDTNELADKFTHELRGGEVIALSGNLGSGKTTFVQFVAQVLGVKEIVQSPTFVIMKIYTGDVLQVCHIDTYRLNAADELDAIGANDFLGDPKTVTFIEWPERVKDSLPSDVITISFEILFAS